MKKKWIITLCIAALFLLIGALIGPIMSNVETPVYKILSTDNNIEVRRYEPMIVAQVIVKGDRKNAIKSGFRILADYIFGNNRLEKDIKMTRPVQQQMSKKIPMTAPVQQQSFEDLWKISFIMPAEYNIDSLPKPNNNQVTLKKTSAQKYIVIKFSGTSSDANIDKHKKILMNYIKTQDIKVIGTPIYAFYNPPWTLPIMRRNEIMIEIAK